MDTIAKLCFAVCCVLVGIASLRAIECLVENNTFIMFLSLLCVVILGLAAYLIQRNS